MPAVIPFIPLISAGIGVGGGIAASKMGAKDDGSKTSGGGITPYVPLISAGIGALGTYAASRSQSGAMKDANRTQYDAATEGIAFERDRLASETAYRAEQDRYKAQQDALARKQWEQEFAESQARAKAQQDLALQQFRLSEMGFQSSEADRLLNRRLTEERDARLMPYRQAGSEALGRLPALIGPSGQLAWRSPSQAGRGPSLGDLVR